MSTPFNLNRFVQAQDEVRRELGEGRKRTHWMWFVFPQLEGLGHSAMARGYAIGSLAEAQAYLGHPVLGPRLVECTGLVNALEGRPMPPDSAARERTGQPCRSTSTQGMSVQGVGLLPDLAMVSEAGEGNPTARQD